MDLLEVRKSAEAVLGGVDSDDWRATAQGQARNVLGIVDLVASSEAKYDDLSSSINSELAQLKAEAGDLATQKERTRIAEEQAKDLSAQVADLTKERDELRTSVTNLRSVVESVQASSLAVAEALKANG